MTKCTYIIYIHNNRQTLIKIIESLKKIYGTFFKEFIIIDDNSQDHSLEAIKQSIIDLPKTTIITNKQTIGQAASIKKTLSIAQGDYIHFVNGLFPVGPTDTLRLIEACQITNSKLALANYGKKFTDDRTFLITKSSIQWILENNKSILRYAFLSGTLVHLNLLKHIVNIDEEIYVPNIYLCLECAQHTSFTIVPTLLTHKEKHNAEEAFEKYNYLLSIYCFAQKNREIMGNFKLNLIFALYKTLGCNVTKLRYLFKYLTSKYLNTLSFQNIMDYYKKELDRLS